MTSHLTLRQTNAVRCGIIGLDLPVYPTFPLTLLTPLHKVILYKIMLNIITQNRNSTIISCDNTGGSILSHVLAKVVEVHSH
jgi:hypothetical protein